MKALMAAQVESYRHDGSLAGCPCSASRRRQPRCLKENITCNAICPGTSPSLNIEERLAATMAQQSLGRGQAVERFMASRQPSRRLVAMESVAALAAFLCGPGDADLTGAVIPIDGGWSAS